MDSITLTLCLVTGLPLGQVKTDPPPPFRAERFREHIAYLASDELAGRAVDSPGSRLAMKYMLRTLAQNGAAPLDPKGNGLQPFVLATKVEAGPTSRMTIGESKNLNAGTDFAPDPLSSDGRADGEAVFVGFGIRAPAKNRDDFGQADLRDKIVVAFDQLSGAAIQAGLTANPAERWQECERRGAKALVLIQQQPHLRRVMSYGESEARVTRRIPCVQLSINAAHKLFPLADAKPSGFASLLAEYYGKSVPAAGPRSLGLRISLELQVRRTRVTGNNVLTVVPGKGALAGQAVLVSSHHDHLGSEPALLQKKQDGIFNGADDNASGCAALLLVAEALHEDRSKLPDSHRAVIFASFDAEEIGLAGSRYYVRRPQWPLAQTTANLNFDMVGRLHFGKLLALDGESSPYLAERVQALAGACGLRVETRINGSRRSDNANFLDREIPAIHFNSGMHPDYHQVTDELARIDGPGGARISWMVYRLLRETMVVPGRLAYRRASPAFDVQGILQLALRIGMFPETNAQPGSYPLIRFVVPGSIAARHGLQSGDKITSVNGVALQSLYDAAILLGQIRLEEGVRFTVARKETSVDIKFPAEAFKDLLGPAVKHLGNSNYEVLFTYKPKERANTVALAGSFNGWKTDSYILTGPDKTGTYSVRLTLQKGIYEYKFFVNGKTWVADPNNIRTEGSHGNSVILVGGNP